MRRSTSPDAVDAILGQWNKERPDLDVSVMGPIGRLKRCAALLQKRLDETFAEFGISGWEFDVLATLRRSGEPYCLAPTELFSALMVASGTMTNRLQRLEASGFIERHPNPADGRSLLVQLTASGRVLIDAAVEAHLENERAILAPLTTTELKSLDDRLARLLGALEG